MQAPSTCLGVKSSGKGKQKSGMPAEAAIKRRFEFDDESVVLPKVYFDDPNFAIALRDEDETVSSRRSGGSRRAAPVFLSSPR